MSAYSVNISVEAPIENQIQEITYDGQEIYQAPPTMSEHLTKLAQKIDFAKTGPEDLNKDIAEIDKNEEEGDQSKAPPLWPWDSVRNKLRNALTEASVLADVLTIAKERHYMVLDPVPQDPPEQKQMVQVYARKKALGGAASVLLSGADRLKNSQAEALRNRTSTPDFHVELLRLRQNFRLKKVSNTIIGDLSYRTAGSKFAQNGTFEVTKAEDDPENPLSPPCSPNASAPSKAVSALRVTVPSELQGVAFIKVYFQKDQETLCSNKLNMPAPSTANAIPDMYWQPKLEAAQNVLFCKELFNQLAKDAVQIQSPIPHMVVGNQIIASVLPGVQLVIGLCHSGVATDGKTTAPPPQSNGHDHVLEHTLHQLLRELHHKNTHHPFPHPSSGPIGPSKRRCLAGPCASDRYELLQMTQTQTMLEQVIQQAQHINIRDRTLCVLDRLAKEFKDPLITSHWNALNSPTQSCVKINIVAHGYDTICRTSLLLRVGEKAIKCITRDGRVVHMSYESQELRDFILCQVYQHQITAVQNLAKCMGWQCLANSSQLGIGSVEPLGNASSCILASPTGERLISVRCEPKSGVQVAIAQSPRKDFFPGQLVKERKWENLGGSYKEVRWDKMEGKNFLNKMELLMASLTSS
ncbi:mediator of RNA polymerase II transcription subunit 17 [Neocloeon triangulifer]|uniref:mediator of RNA polymerase II transcription subunit 17 n=1 Tax=Neocloeon triangulifer TaxID=2078957 RepID=UPI00286F68EC|nr:mediator of RNA polymerase II transcription subunit 17 [Neocloeon triangulifer]